MGQKSPFSHLSEQHAFIGLMHHNMMPLVTAQTTEWLLHTVAGAERQTGLSVHSIARRERPSWSSGTEERDCYRHVQAEHTR